MQEIALHQTVKDVDQLNSYTRQVRANVSKLSSAFELFSATVAAELRRQGTFPTILPPFRKSTEAQLSGAAKLPSIPQQCCDESTHGVRSKEPNTARSGIPARKRTLSRKKEIVGVPHRVPFVGLATCNSSSETLEGLVATGVYFLFESLVRQTLAQEAMLLLHQSSSESRTSRGDDAVAVTLFGGKPRPPHNVKVSLRTGIVGAVFRSGFAVNVQPEIPTDSNCCAMCFPIFPVNMRTAPVGAILLQKKEGNVSFTKEDEAITYSWCFLAAQLLTQYGVDLTSTPYFDPHRTLLKREKISFSSLDAFSKMFGAPGGESTAAKGVTASILQNSNYNERLARLIAGHPVQQLVFRTVHHNHFTAVRGAHIGGPGVTLQTQNLMDVAEYVANLEDCWKRTLEDLQGIEAEQVAKLQDFRERKKKLKTSQNRVQQLENQCNNYKAKYESLKQELSVVCGSSIDVSPADVEDVPSTGVRMDEHLKNGAGI